MQANTFRGETLDDVRVLFDAGGVAALSDGQLLERFAGRAGETSGRAFAALVERHGATVWGVCLGVLADRHDAEDAFQATFLVLARRAKVIRRRESVASWLYGVALRVASQARSAAARRRKHERNAARPAGSAADGPAPDDVAPLVHEEIGRLPERYREPVVLCLLRELTHEEAARQLGWPVGTVKSRLARGKQRLRDRLARRGLAPTAAVPGLAGLPGSGSFPVPARLAAATVKAAAAPAGAGLASASVETLVRGVVRGMTVTRGTAAATAVLSIVVLGAGVVALAGGGTGDSQETRPADEPAGAGQPGTARSDHEVILALEGRIRELERKVAELSSPRTAGRPPGLSAPGPETVRKVRPRFECTVEKIFVRRGDRVRTGDPLVELHSAELLAAKTQLFTASVQHDHDRNLLTLREKLVEKGAISQQLWVDTRDAEQKSRLECAVARDRLALYGLSSQETDAVKTESPEAKPRFTLRSPVAGTVLSVELDPYDLADAKTVILTIRTSPPEEGRRVPATAADPVALRTARPPFACRVESIPVKAGQAVKKGDALAEVFSTELAQAKNDYRARISRHDLSQTKLKRLKKLIERGVVSSEELAALESDEETSRLEVAGARDRLVMYGLSRPEIDAIQRGDPGDDNARFTLRSPVDGVVASVEVGPQDMADAKTVLLTIRPKTP